MTVKKAMKIFYFVCISFIAYLSFSHNLITSITAGSAVEYDDNSCFQCQDSYLSIPQECKCNGHMDCSDTDVSDELNCGNW
jgi:hypothetical protein